MEKQIKNPIVQNYRITVIFEGGVIKEKDGKFYEY